MSDTWLIVFPTDPGWLPDTRQERRAAEVIARLVPAARQPELTRTAGIELIDAGTNFETIRCPRCRLELDMSWWDEQMNRQCSRDNGFDLPPIVTPCCGASTGLNDLTYEWPQGFARWTASVLYPDRGWLTDGELGEIGQALGHPVRHIFRHL